jgi:hypothetical protein
MVSTCWDVPWSDIKINLNDPKASTVCRELICLVRANFFFFGKLLELILSVAIH